MKQLGALILSVTLVMGNPVFAAGVDADKIPSSPCASTLKEIWEKGDEDLKADANKYFRDGELEGMSRKEACADLERRLTEAGLPCPNGRCNEPPRRDVEQVREVTYEAQSGGSFTNTNLLWGLGGALLGGVVGYMAGKNNWFGADDNNNGYPVYNPGGPQYRPGWWRPGYPPPVLPMPGMPGMGMPGMPGMPGYGMGGMPGYGMGGMPGMPGYGMGGMPGYGMGGGYSGGAPTYIPGYGYAGGTPIYNGGNMSSGGYYNAPAVLPYPVGAYYNTNPAIR